MSEQPCAEQERTAPGTVTITLEIEGGSAPVAGTVAVEGDGERPFMGWIELSNAIAAACERTGA